MCDETINAKRGRDMVYSGEKILRKGLCHKSNLSLRATKGSVAISTPSENYEIASVASIPRNDDATQSQREGRGKEENRRRKWTRIRLPKESVRG